MTWPGVQATARGSHLGGERRRRITQSLGVHLADIIHSVLQGISSSHVHSLLGLHGCLHHRVVRLEGVDVILGLGKHLGLDALAQAVLTRRVGKKEQQQHTKDVHPSSIAKQATAWRVR